MKIEALKLIWCIYTLMCPPAIVWCCLHRVSRFLSELAVDVWLESSDLPFRVYHVWSRKDGTTLQCDPTWSTSSCCM